MRRSIAAVLWAVLLALAGCGEAGNFATAASGLTCESYAEAMGPIMDSVVDELTAMGEMASGIAHEINQPLAIIRMAADGLNRYFEKRGEESMEARAAFDLAPATENCSSSCEASLMAG